MLIIIWFWPKQQVSGKKVYWLSLVLDCPRQIGHFRVPLSLSFKASLGAKLLL